MQNFSNTMPNVLAWSKSVIVTTPIRWLNLVQVVPIELLSMLPAPNEWSALDYLQHLVEAERDSFPVRIKAFLAGTSFPGFTPGNHRAKAPPTIALAAKFDKLRKATLALLDQVTEADSERQALHAEYGIVSIREFITGPRTI
ncbi:MAG: DinB family protein [Aggregatilineales bacterium]